LPLVSNKPSEADILTPVKVLLVKISVVALPTNVSVVVGKVNVPVLTIVENIGLVSVLLVSVVVLEAVTTAAPPTVVPAGSVVAPVAVKATKLPLVGFVAPTVPFMLILYEEDKSEVHVGAAGVPVLTFQVRAVVSQRTAPVGRLVTAAKPLLDILLRSSIRAFSSSTKLVYVLDT
jgi:hypothetical protein